MSKFYINSIKYYINDLLGSVPYALFENILNYICNLISRRSHYRKIYIYLCFVNILHMVELT